MESLHNRNIYTMNKAGSQARRVMTLGYDSDVAKFFGGAANKNTFYNHAGNLLGALVRKRKVAVCIRPHNVFHSIHSSK